MRNQFHVFKYYGDTLKDNMKGGEKKLHSLCTATATYNIHKFTFISNILDRYHLFIMVLTRSELTPEQRQVANSNKRDKYNERQATELRVQLDIKDKEVAAEHSLLHPGNKLFDKKEHRARTVTISSYQTWQERHGPKALWSWRVARKGCSAVDASKLYEQLGEDWEGSLAMENTSGTTVLAKEWPNDGEDTFDSDCMEYAPGVVDRDDDSGGSNPRMT